ncbi:MAG: DnaA ATPase domain-containing protein [Planctomycetota bacterium]
MPTQPHTARKRPSSSSTAARRVAKELEQCIGLHKYDMWFAPLTRLSVQGDRLQVATDSPFAASWIENHFASDLEGAARSALGECARIEICVAPEMFRSDNGTSPTTGNGAPPPQRRHPATNGGAARPKPSRRTGGLRRLEDVVVGPSNKLAYSAARRLCEEPDGGLTSPLFIHGECGVGKTHLLQGISQRYAELSGHWGSVRFVTGEQFTNEYLTAIRRNTVDAFRKRSRTRELLAIDDVHFLSNKVATQSEFLHTIDAMDLSGARIVLASDEHPRTIKRFSQALISRFLSGMVVKIDRPDREMRLKLVERFAASRALRLSPAAIDAIADDHVGSVRELEGAVTKLAALRAVASPEAGNKVVGLSLVEQLLRERAWRPATPVRIATVIETVCERLAVARGDLLGPRRHRRVVLARGLIAHLGRELTTLSYPELADALGRAHHSTMHTAARRLREQLGRQEMIDVGNGGSPMDLRELVDDLTHGVLRATSQT